MAKKYLDDNGLLYFWQKIKSMFVTDVNYDSTNKKITKTKNGSTSDVVTIATVKSALSLTKSDVGLGNVDNTADANKTVSKASTLTNARTIDGVSFNGSANISHWGSCSISTRTGTVACTGFTLAAGAWIAVYFPSTNSTSSTDPLLLNVNGTGGKEIKYYAGTDQSIPANANIFCTNRTYLIVYDGSNYRLVGDLDTHTEYDAGTAAQLTAGTVLQNEVWSPKILHDYINGVCVPGAAYPLMDGTVAVGTSVKYAREDHRHPSDTSKVSESVFSAAGYSGASDFVTKTENAVNQRIATSQKGAANGVCPLNASSKIDATYLPSYVDDVIEAYARSGQTALSQNWLATGSASGTVITPETGKIYVLMADSGDYAANTQFRWSGTTYVKLNDGGVTSITNAEIDTIVAA